MCACLAVLPGMLYMKLKCIAMKFEHYKNLVYLGLLTPMMQGALDAGALIFCMCLMHLESRQNNTLVY